MEEEEVLAPCSALEGVWRRRLQGWAAKVADTAAAFPPLYPFFFVR